MSYTQGISETPSEGSDIVIMESDDEHDQLLSNSLRTDPKPVKYIFINEFAPDNLKGAIINSPRPTQAAKKPQQGHKQKTEALSEPVGEDDDSDEQSRVRSTGKSKGAKAKKAKTSCRTCNKLAVFESNDETQPQSLSVRAYLHLETISQQQGRRKKLTMVTVMKSIQCNPFIFTVESTFKAFVQEVASAAKTTMANLTLSRLRWKFETPASLPMKLLTDEIGFQAMLDAVQERTMGHTIFLYLPKPINLEGPPEMSSLRDNTYYEEDEDSSIRPEQNMYMFHKAQINAMRQESTKEVVELERRYPIGSHPLFPNKHIYAKNGMFLELTSLCLNCQSTQSDPRATYDMPLMSNYFTKDKAIKPARPPPGSSMTMFAAYGAYVKGEDYTPDATASRGDTQTALDNYYE
ncbi:hypothetical protein EV702DRAFT_1045283 [Suillus placidus]|uniref:Uncharacterized protein n=1 Tax=Suillus placidus TaxID=48579 RepID=A0A9P7D3X4_9AGAM|nr:hypothetical protein EV702DRAFT_1045283 [Suillus placidus]